MNLENPLEAAEKLQKDKKAAVRWLSHRANELAASWAVNMSGEYYALALADLTQLKAITEALTQIDHNK